MKHETKVVLKYYGIAAIILIAIVIFISSCTYKIGGKNVGDLIYNGRFLIVDKQMSVDDGKIYIICDTQTNVEYFYIYTGGGYAMSPVYNSDGSLKIYGKDNNGY